MHLPEIVLPAEKHAPVLILARSMTYLFYLANSSSRHNQRYKIKRIIKRISTKKRKKDQKEKEKEKEKEKKLEVENKEGRNMFVLFK